MRFKATVMVADGTTIRFKSRRSLCQYLRENHREVAKIVVKFPKDWAYYVIRPPIDQNDYWHVAATLYDPEVAEEFNICNAEARVGTYAFDEMIEFIRSI